MDGREPRSILARHLPVTSPDARPLDERISVTSRSRTPATVATGSSRPRVSVPMTMPRSAGCSTRPAALLWHALEVAPDAAGRLSHRTQTYLETYTEPDVGDTFEVVEATAREKATT